MGFCESASHSTAEPALKSSDLQENQKPKNQDAKS